MNNRSILTCTALFFASVAVADTQTLNGYTWTYAINGDSVEIYGTSSEPAVSPIPSGEVIIPSYIDEKPVTSIGDYSFCNCSNITRVTLPVKLSSIGYQAFYKCSSLDDVTMPDGLKTIGYSAFQYCSSMREIRIPDTVVTLGACAFSDCYALSDVSIGCNVSSLEKDTFAECDALTAVHISDLKAWCALDFQSDEDNPLSYAHNLYLNGTLVEDLRIPGNVDKIGAYAFYGCTSITNVAIPNTVTRVGYNAFWSCDNLASASLPPCLCSGGLNDGHVVFRDVFGDSPLTHLSINEGVERVEDIDCETVTNVDIPDTVVDIGDMAFAWCRSLESISIPSSVTNIGERAFEQCEALTSVHISDLAAWCVLGRSWWRSPMNNPLYYARNLYLNGTLVEDLRIPEGVKEIGPYAFYGCTAITNVVIPGSVTRMGGEVFSQCTNLMSATVPQYVCDPRSMDSDYCGSSMEFFMNCPLMHLKIAEGATSIGHDAFGSDTLESVEIPNTVTNIGREAFFYCPRLTRIEIPDSVEEIGGNAFLDCQTLTNIVIGTGLKRVAYGAFDTYCEYTDIHIRDMAAWCGIEFLGRVRYNDLYLNGELVEDLVIPDGVTEVPSAFGYYKRLVHVTIPASVTNFTEDAFSECTSLKSATFLGDAPDHVEYSGTFRNVSHDFIVYIPRGNDTYELDAEGRWHGMVVVRYGLADETTPNIAGDNGAVVEESADCDFTILPSVGNADVVVTIPDGIEPANVTVEVNADVATVKPNGAAIKVVSGGNDITAYISEASLLPDVYGVVNLAAASLDKAAVFEEDTPGDNAESVANVIEAALDDNVMESTVKSAKPGLYYSMEASNDIAFPNDVAKTKYGVAAMARSNTVIIAKPEKPAGKTVFYRIKVSKVAK